MRPAIRDEAPRPYDSDGNTRTGGSYEGNWARNRTSTAEGGVTGRDSTAQTG